MRTAGVQVARRQGIPAFDEPPAGRARRQERHRHRARGRLATIASAVAVVAAWVAVSRLHGVPSVLVPSAEPPAVTVIEGSVTGATLQPLPAASAPALPATSPSTLPAPGLAASGGPGSAGNEPATQVTIPDTTSSAGSGWNGSIRGGSGTTSSDTTSSGTTSAGGAAAPLGGTSGSAQSRPGSSSGAGSSYGYPFWGHPAGQGSAPNHRSGSPGGGKAPH
jgi:hypothetical protein